MTNTTLGNEESPRQQAFVSRNRHPLGKNGMKSDDTTSAGGTLRACSGPDLGLRQPTSTEAARSSTTDTKPWQHPFHSSTSSTPARPQTAEAPDNCCSKRPHRPAADVGTNNGSMRRRPEEPHSKQRCLPRLATAARTQ